MEGGSRMTRATIRRMTGATVVQSAILEAPNGIVHAFSTRQGGVSRPPFATLNLGQSVGDEPAVVEENRRRFFGTFGIDLGRVVRAWQAHGDGVLRVDAGLTGRAGFPRCLLDERAKFDALITHLPGLALVVSTADCLPILIHDPVRRAVAAVHAGWRGTAKRIAARALAAMREAYGTDPSDCRAAIGPGIRGCCFEVDAAVRMRSRRAATLGGARKGEPTRTLAARPGRDQSGHSGGRGGPHRSNRGRRALHELPE
jgi:YfiH family protein